MPVFNTQQGCEVLLRESDSPSVWPLYTVWYRPLPVHPAKDLSFPRSGSQTHSRGLRHENRGAKVPIKIASPGPKSCRPLESCVRSDHRDLCLPRTSRVALTPPSGRYLIGAAAREVRQPRGEIKVGGGALEIRDAAISSPPGQALPLRKERDPVPSK